MALAFFIFFPAGLAFCAEKNKPAQADPKEKAMIIALQLAELNPENPQPQNQPQEKTQPQPPAQTAPGPEKESLAPPIQKGAWTLKKNQLYMESYTKYYWHNHRFNSDGKKKRWDFDAKGDEIRTEVKLEYGLTDTDTLLYSAVAKEAHWKDQFRSSTRKGFVENWPGIKHLLFTAPFICSLQAKAKIPFHYSEEAVPALGTHQVDGELKILTAQPWPKLPGYTKFETGFRARNEEPSNEIPYFFELGYNITQRLILKTTLDGNESLAQTGGTNEDWVKYTIGPIVKVKDMFTLELGYGHTFIGKNTSAAKEVSVNISSQW